ncbi:MAG: hypothetical protein H0U27_09190, partial [Nitrosopumilus sp.]|nr:hypothetical protein [Nitrosopumilus sp.]
MKTIYKQFQGILIILYLMSIPVLIKAQPNNPCNSVTSINCGVPVTSVISPGSGLFDATNCYDYQYGQENIFEFTSGDAGTYTISTTGWGAIQFAIKAAVNGCDATGWNCIDPIYGEGTYLLGSLAANTTYYLLHDVSSTYGESTTFQVDCFAPNFPCQNITAIPGCGIPVNAFIPPGFGAYSSIQCQYYNNEGKERIYSFIPAASGIYTLTLNQNNYSYSTAGFSYKKASDGCNELSWNCITETSFDNTYLIGYLKQGITYYILQDAYSIAGSDFTMQVDCNTPSDPCATPIITSCGVINDIIIPSGVGSFNEGSCFNANDPTAGKEIIFQFTPSATGNSVINITSMSYDYPVRYYFKEAAGGCNANNWTCLGESNTPVMVIPVTLVSGTTYLLMADGVNYNGGLQSFEITCPVAWDPCASVVPI